VAVPDRPSLSMLLSFHSVTRRQPPEADSIGVPSAYLALRTA
jgi:hypothetical protein